METMLAAAALDLADCRAAFVLAAQTLDQELESRAVAKYRALCDVLHTFGISIALVPVV